jgi:hypothetical protein
VVYVVPSLKTQENAGGSRIETENTCLAAKIRNFQEYLGDPKLPLERLIFLG